MERLKHIVQINILLGAWLIVAPFILGYSRMTFELGNDIVVGVVLLGCAWWILASLPGQVGAAILQLLVGIWLVATPFSFHYEKLSRVYTNDLIAGSAVAIVSVAATWLLARRLRYPA